MTFGRVAEALPQAIGCVSWQKLVKSFFFFFFFCYYWLSPYSPSAMSDADSAGSHGRAGKALRSAGGRVARVRKQFEAASALPSPSARTTASAPQVPAATGAPKSAGRKRKASQQRLAATAAASPDPAASGSTPAAPPAKPPATSWRDVLMGNSPDDRHTIQALIAEVEQLKKLINNNRAQSDRQHDLPLGQVEGGSEEAKGSSG